MLLETDMVGCTCNTKIGGCASNEYYWRNHLSCEDCPNTVRGSKNIQVLTAAIHETRRIQKFANEIQTIFTNNSSNLYWEPMDFTDASSTDCQMENAVIRECENGCNLYIGKAYHDGEWKIGTVFSKENPDKGLHVRDSFGKSHTILNFDILKYGTTR